MMISRRGVEGGLHLRRRERPSFVVGLAPHPSVLWTFFETELDEENEKEKETRGMRSDTLWVLSCLIVLFFPRK